MSKSGALPAELGSLNLPAATASRWAFRCKMSDDTPLFVLDWDFETFSVLDRKGDVVQLYDIYEHYLRGYCKSEHPEYILIMGWLWCGRGEMPATLYKRANGKRDIYKRVLHDHT